MADNAAHAQAHDAVVIGGGFYGASIALYLTVQKGLSKVLILEREEDLLTRASLNNQSRVHNGYHYPRSFTTAYRSRVNLPKFVRDFPHAVKRDFTKLYAIARRNSKVTAKQFERFCREIGAKITPAPASLSKLFEPRLIEQVFMVEEYAFDAVTLRKWARDELNQAGVEVRLNTEVKAIFREANDVISVDCESDDGAAHRVLTRRVFNCTYSGLNQFNGDFPGTEIKLKHEITEMALMDVPPVLKNMGVTVMDGPFFSLMPFPSRDLHTLSHVRYTPHVHWEDEKGVNPYQRLGEYDKASRVDRMIRDAARYMPIIRNSNYIDSLFEVKTVLVKNEVDDGRPILFERHADLPGCYSVLGGKIDNIYDVLEKLDEEKFH